MAATGVPRLRDVASVIVVDDDTTVAEVVVGYLQRAGHAVVSVADGPAALGAVRDAPPDLIVLDLMLPRIRRARGLPTSSKTIRPALP
jgi:CheY-like chemotaxis protein